MGKKNIKIYKIKFILGVVKTFLKYDTNPDTMIEKTEYTNKK